MKCRYCLMLGLHPLCHSQGWSWGIRDCAGEGLQMPQRPCAARAPPRMSAVLCCARCAVLQMKEKYDVLIQRAFGGDKLFQVGRTLLQGRWCFIIPELASACWVQVFSHHLLYAAHTHDPAHTHALSPAPSDLPPQNTSEQSLKHFLNLDLWGTAIYLTLNRPWQSPAAEHAEPVVRALHQPQLPVT